MRNGKKTAVLAVVIDKKTKSKGKKQEKVYVIYRPNTGQQVCLIKEFCQMRRIPHLMLFSGEKRDGIRAEEKV